MGVPGDGGEVFKKLVKFQWIIYNFLKILKEISRFFQNYFKILSHFGENLDENWEKFRDMHL